MLPVSRASVLSRVTVSVPCTEWLTPIVQASDARARRRRWSGPGRATASASMPLSSAARSSVQPARWASELVEAVDVRPAARRGRRGPRRAARARMPLSRAMSPRGRTGRWTSATIAVLVTRGSTTITVAAGPAPSSRGASSGWLSAMLAPHSTTHVGQLEVVVAPGRAVGAEAQLVAGHRAGHAQRGVAVVVARGPCRAAPACRARRTPRSPAGRWRARPPTPGRVARSGRRKPLDHVVEGLRPSVAGRPSTTGAVSRPSARDRVVLGQALGAEATPVHRVVGVALRRRRPGRRGRRAASRSPTEQ